MPTPNFPFILNGHPYTLGQMRRMRDALIETSPVITERGRSDLLDLSEVIETVEMTFATVAWFDDNGLKDITIDDRRHALRHGLVLFHVGRIKEAHPYNGDISIPSVYDFYREIVETDEAIKGDAFTLEQDEALADDIAHWTALSIVPNPAARPKLRLAV